jgi:TonB family protein
LKGARHQFMERKLLKGSLLASVGLHLILFILLFRTTNSVNPQSVSTSMVIELSPQSPVMSRQIVHSTEGRHADESKPDAFLGEFTRVVERETVVKNDGVESAEGSKAKPRPAAQPLPALGKLRAPLFKAGVNPPSLKPEDAIEWANAGNGVVDAKGGDYVKGIREGEVNALNTKEFIFYSYFERVRKQLDQNWRPILRDQVDKMIFAGRTIASDMDHVTKVMVTLDNGGEIVKISVLEESGTRDLDQAAIKAFNKAGPFPNPPKGLVNKSGIVEIRWDFILKT